MSACGRKRTLKSSRFGRFERPVSGKADIQHVRPNYRRIAQIHGLHYAFKQAILDLTDLDESTGFNPYDTGILQKK